jgi:glycerol-3-phosphate acyltransferase PlsY
MNAHPILISAVVGYLLGSIPFGYLLVRIFRGADVRSTGSGNIGATNVARTSPTLGIVTLLLDAGKGFAAVASVSAIYPGVKTMAFAAAFFAIAGHIFPVWLGFHGGKGVATGLGSFLLLTPKAILIAIGIFLAIAAVFRWVALASIVATISLPVLACALGEVHRNFLEPQVCAVTAPTAWLAAGSIVIVAKHHSNIRRMLASTEPRFHLKHK